MAQAGFLSMLGLEANTASAEALNIPHNSQNIPLPEANFNIGVTDSKSQIKNGTDIVVAGGALVSDSGPLGTQADDVSDIFVSDKITLYTAKRGDSLKVIADIFGISVGTLLSANNLSVKATIHEGDELLILPVTGVQYTIKKGDTLKKIATKFNVPIEDIGLFNGFEQDSKLTVGDSIIIPDGELSAPVVKKNPTSSGQKTVAESKSKVSGGSGQDTYYMRPINGGVRTQAEHGRNGVDIGGSKGASVFASAGGTVIVAKNDGYNTGYGKYIVINHPERGSQTLYAHLSEVNVVVGQTVRRGEMIGVVGSTGHSTGPHLHFEVRGDINPIVGNRSYGL